MLLFIVDVSLLNKYITLWYCLPDRLFHVSWFLNGKQKKKSNDLVLLCFNVLVIFFCLFQKDVVLWAPLCMWSYELFCGWRGLSVKVRGWVCACKVISVGTIDAQPAITGHCLFSFVRAVFGGLWSFLFLILVKVCYVEGASNGHAGVLWIVRRWRRRASKKSCRDTMENCRRLQTSLSRGLVRLKLLGVGVCFSVLL